MSELEKLKEDREVIEKHRIWARDKALIANENWVELERAKKEIDQEIFDCEKMKTIKDMGINV